MEKGHYFPKLISSKLVEISLGLIFPICILLIVLFNIPGASSLVNLLDGQIYDQITNLNLRQPAQTPKVIIIDIDEHSVEKEGRWPWPRDKMASLLTKLKQGGVVTIGMDIVMSDAEINYALGLKKKLQELTSKPTNEQQKLLNTLDAIAPKVDNDQALITSLQDHNTVLGFLFHNDASIKKGSIPSPLTDPNGNPIAANNFSIYQFRGYNGSYNRFMNSATKAGFVTNLPDKDGTFRHALMFANHNNHLYPSLALATAMDYLLVEHVTPVITNKKLSGIQLDGLFIPTNSLSQILIPFWGGAGTLDYYSATDILQGNISPNHLEGSIAVIGSSMTLLADLHQAPVGQLFPGVEMVGNMIQGLISQQLLSEYDWHTLQGGLFILLYGLILAILLTILGVIGKLLISIASLITILATVISLFLFKNIYVPCACLVILTMLQLLVSYSYSFIKEKLQIRKISELFGQYVPQDYVKKLIELPQQHSMEGQTLNMTVLFADIRNFTGISETLDAIGVTNLLNSFFTPITEIIFNHHGTIDKYVGDMIIAFWGAPLDNKEHAYDAIMCSLAIFKNLPSINEKLVEMGLPAVNIGIGLSTGLMNVGDMGSLFRRAYTVLGDTVNLGSRLQDLTKFYGVNILVNDTNHNGQDKILWRAIDKVSVKGRKSALTIYQPVEMVEEAPHELIAELKIYADALNHYYAQNWSLALLGFSELRNQYPDVYLYKLYMERTEGFIKTPPSPDWNGVYLHTHK